MKKILLATVLGSSMLASAGGFQLNVQSVRAIGLGGAYAGFCKGPSSVFFNPGGMTNLTGHHFSAGVSFVLPLVSLQTNETDNINQTSGMATPLHFYYSGQVADNLFVGLSINNQFGSSSSFEDDWQGRFIVQNIGLRTFTFQPTIAYKLRDYLSVGAGFMFTTGAFSYEKAVPVGSTEYDYGKASLSGSGFGYGFNVGLFSTPINNDKMVLSIGSSYRAGQRIDLDNGIVNFTDIPISLQGTFPAETGFTSGLSLPFVFTGGFSFRYNINEAHSLTLVADYNLTGWSSYDKLEFNFDNADTPDSETLKNWENAPTYRFGIEYGLNNKLYLRAGGYYDVTPIPDGYVSPELPDATQFVPTAGIGFRPIENLAFDLSWIHQDAEREASLDDAGWNAKYHRVADVISFSVSYNF